MIGTDSLEEAARSINLATSRLVEAAKNAASQLAPERPSSASSQVILSSAQLLCIVRASLKSSILT